MKMHVAVQQMQVRYHTGQKIEKRNIYMLMRTALMLMMAESPLSQLSVIQKVK
jgi:hypothetical protein